MTAKVLSLSRNPFRRDSLSTPFVEALFHGSPAQPPDDVSRSLSMASLRMPVLQRAQRTYGNRVCQQIVMRAQMLQRQSAAADQVQFEAIPPTAGEPIHEGVSKSLEAHFAADLSDLRVHTSSEGARSATSLNSVAYTAGHNIYFAPGMYAPGSTEVSICWLTKSRMWFNRAQARSHLWSRSRRGVSRSALLTMCWKQKQSEPPKSSQKVNSRLTKRSGKKSMMSLRRFSGSSSVNRRLHRRPVAVVQLTPVRWNHQKRVRQLAPK